MDHSDLVYLPSAVPFGMLNHAMPSVLESDPVQDSTVSDLPYQLIEQRRQQNQNYVESFARSSSAATTLPYMSDSETDSFYSHDFDSESDFDVLDVTVDTNQYLDAIDVLAGELDEPPPIPESTSEPRANRGPRERRSKTEMTEAYRMQNNDPQIPQRTLTRQGRDKPEGFYNV